MDVIVKKSRLEGLTLKEFFKKAFAIERGSEEAFLPTLFPVVDGNIAEEFSLDSDDDRHEAYDTFTVNLRRKLGHKPGYGDIACGTITMLSGDYDGNDRASAAVADWWVLVRIIKDYADIAGIMLAAIPHFTLDMKEAEVYVIMENSQGYDNFGNFGAYIEENL